MSLILTVSNTAGTSVQSEHFSNCHCATLSSNIQYLPFATDTTLVTHWLKDADTHEALWIDEEWPSAMHLQTWINSCLAIMPNVCFVHMHIPVDGATQLAVWTSEWRPWLEQVSQRRPGIGLSWRFRGENIPVIAWLDQWAMLKHLPMQVFPRHHVNTVIQQRASVAGTTLAERFQCRMHLAVPCENTRGAETCRHQIDGVTVVGFVGGFLALRVDGCAEVLLRDTTFANRKMTLSSTSKIPVAEQHLRTLQRHMLCVYVEANLTIWSVNAEGMVLKWRQGKAPPIVVRQLTDLQELTLWVTDDNVMVQSDSVLCVIPRDEYKLTRFFQKSTASVVAREHDAMYVEAGAFAAYVVGNDVFVKRP